MCVSASGPSKKSRPPALGVLLARSIEIAVFSPGDALDHRLDGASGLLVAAQTRLDHLGVVHHKQIARAKKLADVGEDEILDHVLRHVQQPRSRTVLKRILCDQFRGKVEVVVGQVLSDQIGRMNFY